MSFRGVSFPASGGDYVKDGDASKLMRQAGKSKTKVTEAMSQLQAENQTQPAVKPKAAKKGDNNG